MTLAILLIEGICKCQIEKDGLKKKKKKKAVYHSICKIPLWYYLGKFAGHYTVTIMHAS